MHLPRKISKTPRYPTTSAPLDQHPRQSCKTDVLNIERDRVFSQSFPRSRSATMSPAGLKVREPSHQVQLVQKRRLGARLMY